MIVSPSAAFAALVRKFEVASKGDIGVCRPLQSGEIEIIIAAVAVMLRVSDHTSALAILLLLLLLISAVAVNDIVGTLVVHTACKLLISM